MIRILLILLVFSMPALAAPKGSVQVIVDASKSASSLGTVLGEVRAATEKVRPIDVSVRLAGGAGGRDEPCRTTRAVVPPGVSAAPVLEAIAPKTKAGGPLPLAAAIEGAAADLSSPGGVPKGLVIVTHVDDQCGFDACDVMAEVRRSQSLGQVLVLFVGGDRTAARRLACAGRFEWTKAREVGERLGAFLDGFSEPPTLQVSATNAGSAGVEIFAAGDEVPAAQGKAGGSFSLSSGRWHVRVFDDAGREGWRRDVELAAGSKVSVRVALEGTSTASLAVNVRLNGRAAPAGTRLFVHRPGLVDEEVASGWPGEPFEVPAGTWDVRAVIPGGPMGNLEVWKPEVKVAGGARVSFVLDAAQKLGFLRVNVTSGDVVLDDAFATLVPDGSRAEEGASLGLGQAEPTPTGRYSVRVQWDTPGGSILRWKDAVAVTHEEITELSVDVGPSGEITVDLPDLPPEAGASVWVIRPRQLEPVGQLVPFVPSRLPAGTYDLRVEQSWPLPRMWWRKGVVVKAGDAKMVIVKTP